MGVDERPGLAHSGCAGTPTHRVEHLVRPHASNRLCPHGRAREYLELPGVAAVPFSSPLRRDLPSLLRSAKVMQTAGVPTAPNG